MDELLKIDPNEIKNLVSQIDNILLLGYDPSIEEPGKTSNRGGEIIPADISSSIPVQKFQQGKNLQYEVPKSIEIEEKTSTSKKIEIIDLVDSDSESELSSQVSKNQNPAGQLKNMYSNKKSKPLCEICKGYFVHLSSHMKVHTQERSFPCLVCSKAFLHKCDLNRHSRIHSDDKLCCPSCPGRFNCKDALQRHIRTHTGERPYACEICNKGFREKAHLKIHLRIHSGIKPLSCDKCGRDFRDPSCLAKHKKFVHRKDDEDEKLFPCPSCPKKFDSLHDLEKHNIFAHTNRPYACEECNKSFRAKCNLINHLRIHSGEKHSCDKCSREFRFPLSLARHKKNVHKLKPST